MPLTFHESTNSFRRDRRACATALDMAVRYSGDIDSFHVPVTIAESISGQLSRRHRSRHCQPTLTDI